MKRSQDRSSKVAQILPEPTLPEGLSSASMARVLKAAQENPQTITLNRQRQIAPSTSQPLTAQAYAEHLAGRSLSPEELQPAQPSLAQTRRDQSTRSMTPNSSET